MINLSMPITYPADTTPQQRTESEEFRSMLLTCLLAAELNRDKPNTAVRSACAHMLKRFEGERTTQDIARSYTAGAATGLYAQITKTC